MIQTHELRWHLMLLSYPQNGRYKEYRSPLITVNNALFAIKKCDIAPEWGYIFH